MNIIKSLKFKKSKFSTNFYIIFNNKRVLNISATSDDLDPIVGIKLFGQKINNIIGKQIKGIKNITSESEDILIIYLNDGLKFEIICKPNNNLTGEETRAYLTWELI